MKCKPEKRGCKVSLAAAAFQSLSAFDTHCIPQLILEERKYYRLGEPELVRGSRGGSGDENMKKAVQRAMNILFEKVRRLVAAPIYVDLGAENVFRMCTMAYLMGAQSEGKIRITVEELRKLDADYEAAAKNGNVKEMKAARYKMYELAQQTELNDS